MATPCASACCWCPTAWPTSRRQALGGAHAAGGGAHARHGRAGARGIGRAWCAPCPTAWRRAATWPTWPCSATTRRPCSRGRSPLEAASIGVELGPDDVAYRCNFVTIAGRRDARQHRRPHPNDEADAAVRGPQAALGGDQFEFYAGVSYRNLMVWRGGEVVPCTPPHDILDQPVAGHLPAWSPAGRLARRGACRRCRAQPPRCSAPLRPAPSVWFWGEGTAPQHAALRRPVRPARRRGRRRRPGARHRPLRRHGRRATCPAPPATWTRTTPPRRAPRWRRWPTTTSSGSTSRRPTRPSHMGSLDEKLRAIERVDAEVLAPLLAAPRAPGRPGAAGPLHAAAHAHPRRRAGALRARRPAAARPLPGRPRPPTARPRRRPRGCWCRTAPR